MTTRMPPAPRLLVRAVSKAFGATRALDGVALEVGAGEVHAVIGENGAGKSTLMHILAGSFPADSGEITLDGKPFAANSPAAARALGVSLVSQELSVCPHLSVLDNVMLGQERTRSGWLDRRTMRKQVLASLAPLAGPSAERWLARDTLVRELSLPNQQLVEIARALVGRSGCRVLILDEPTSSLGREDAERLFEVVRRLAADGMAVLYISHFLEEVRSVADRFTVLRDGATVGTGAISQTETAEMVRLMAGRRIDSRRVRSNHEPGDVALELVELAAHPRPTRASLALCHGEIFGIFGLVGAGRTELVRAIFGLEPVRSGKIRVKTWEGPRTPRERLDQGVGLLSEDRKGEGLAATLSIADNLTLSKLPVGRLGRLGRRHQLEVTARWIKELGIKADSPTDPVARLSGGNQQKVALGRLLHHDADVLLLDEPTRGIDVASKAHIYDLVEALARGGKAILVVSSYVPELLGLCDRIAVMRRGELGPARPVGHWTEQMLLEEATGAVA